MTAGASHSDSRVHELALGLVFVTRDAGGGVGVLVERHWMLGRINSAGEKRQNQQAPHRPPSISLMV